MDHGLDDFAGEIKDVGGRSKNAIKRKEQVLQISEVDGGSAILILCLI